jgi:DNA-binding LacI/PurR family transcriptional regulator
MLAKAHIECKSWPIVRKGGIEDILRATLAAFYRKMERHGRAWLPDVLYFNDNFAAQSALIALLESKVDIPGEVRFVTWSNRGEGPFWRKELTRIEIDPFESGRIFARYVLKYLSGRKIPEASAVSPVFIVGET